MKVHRALIAAEVVSPDMVEEFGSRPRPTGMSEQEGQQVEFPRLETQDPLSAACDHALEVHPEVQMADETASGLPARPSENTPDAGQHLTKVIGLQDIVVGARVEAMDAGFWVASPAHDDEGDRTTGGPELPAELDAVSVRERGLEDDRVEVSLKSPASTLQIDGGLGLVPFLPESVHEFSAFAGVLLHHQNADVGRYHFNSGPHWGPAGVSVRSGPVRCGLGIPLIEIGVNWFCLFPSSVQPMNLETQYETDLEGAEKPVLAAWQKVALGVALISTLAGLALGGFGSEAAEVSAASPQANSFAAAAGDTSAPPEASQGPGVWAPLLAKGGLSFFLAFCVGYALRAALKILLLAVGLASLSILGLQYAELVGEIQWERLGEFWRVGVAAARDQVDGLQAFITASLPSAASGTLGMFTGFRRTG